MFRELINNPITNVNMAVNIDGTNVKHMCGVYLRLEFKKVHLNI